MGNNRCPLFTMLTKQNIINVLHSNLVKKKKKKKKKENDLIILGDLPIFEENWSTLTGDLPTHTHWSIFMGDLPHMFI
jgi:hypothetical protein